MMYTRDDVGIIQGKFPHIGVAQRDVSLQELLVNKTPISMTQNSCMMIMSILPTWHKRDLNANIHGDNMSIPST